MPYIGGSKEAVQLLTELEANGDLVRLNSHEWLRKCNEIDSSASISTANNEDVLLVHLNPLRKSFFSRFTRIYPPLSPAIESKRCVFLIINLTLQRVLCVGVDGSDLFVFDPSQGRYHASLRDIDRINLFLRSDGLNQVQKLVDGVAQYVQALREYKSTYRFAEDEVFSALENTADQSDLVVVEIDGESVTRGELLEYDKSIGENTLRMNLACKKIEFFFPDFDFSELNLDEYQ